MTEEQGGQAVEGVAARVHRKAIVIDALTHSPLTKERFGRLRAGGVSAINWTCIRFSHDLEEALLGVSNALRDLEGMAGDCLVVRSVEDILLAKREGRVGVILGFQNGKPLRDRVEFVRVFHALGVRVIQLTYNERNFIGDGCLEKGDAGLSRFGREVIRVMNQIGILIDLSHCGGRTTREAIECSEKPVAITHANSASLTPTPRNKPDEILRALAERGGVAGACVWSPLVARPNAGRPKLQEFLDSLQYAVDLMGIEHVGLGTDHGEGVSKEEWERTFGPKGFYPEVARALGPWYGFETRFVDGLHSPELLGNLTEGLLRRGYREEDIDKVLGGNFLRLFREVW